MITFWSGYINFKVWYVLSKLKNVNAPCQNKWFSFDTVLTYIRPRTKILNGKGLGFYRFGNFGFVFTNPNTVLYYKCWLHWRCDGCYPFHVMQKYKMEFRYIWSRWLFIRKFIDNNKDKHVYIDEDLCYYSFSQ